ncbi:MAG: IS1380 family transposase, partial [Acidimicrobiales bacterium]
IDTFRYKILHMAARICRGGRALRLRLDERWRWAEALATAFGRLRTAFG